MGKENIFALTKSYYENAFKNLAQFQNENEKMVKLFIDNLDASDQSIDDTYSEWIDNTKKGFNDYQDMILKGLDYLSYNLDKNRKNHVAKAS